MSGPRASGQDIDEVAAAWFLRRRSGAWSGADERGLAAWLDADRAHRDSFDLMADTWDAAGAGSASPGIRSLRAEALSLSSAAPPPRRWPAAAAVAVAILTGAGGLYMFRDAMSPPAGTAAAAQVYRTAVGERATVALADGSTASLNTRSELVVDYAPGRRSLRLVSGEAWFDVAKDARRPFVVSAGRHTVTAVGTSFDVRMEPRGLRIAVTEGRVAVAKASGPAISEVKAGERMDVQGDAATVRPATGPLAGDWRQGRIEFASATLADAVAEMNRYRRRPIRLDDPAIGRLRISGVFDAGEASGFLEALPFTHPVAVRDAGAEIHVAWRSDKKTSHPK